MALTGHLNDLSLSELIEFFCNQRKTGRLTVLYPKGSGHFFLHSGSVVDAKIGVLRGIEAVYYALTLANANFEFSASTEATERTINQPWTQVVLEGLRRLDEGITPAEAFPETYFDESKITPVEAHDVSQSDDAEVVLDPPFLSFIAKDAFSKRKPFIASGIAIAVLASIAAAGVPAGWYGRATESPATAKENSSPPAPTNEAPEQVPLVAETSEAPIDSDDDALARKQREKERVKRAGTANDAPATLPPQRRVANPAPANTGPKTVTVTVTYDESGRVTQASGGDPTALRIARQKRFPPGKAGTATVTIPLN